MILLLIIAWVIVTGLSTIGYVREDKTWQAAVMGIAHGFACASLFMVLAKLGAL